MCKIKLIRCLCSFGPGHAKAWLMTYANNKVVDQPAHLRSLISTFVVRCLDSMICILAISKVSRFYLTSAAELSGLNLTRSQIPEDTFSRDASHLYVCSLYTWYRNIKQNLSRDMTKPTEWLCDQRRLRSALASAQSDQSLRCPHEESLGP